MDDMGQLKFVEMWAMEILHSRCQNDHYNNKHMTVSHVTQHCQSNAPVPLHLELIPPHLTIVTVHGRNYSRT